VVEPARPPACVLERPGGERGGHGDYAIPRGSRRGARDAGGGINRRGGEVEPDVHPPAPGFRLCGDREDTRGKNHPTSSPPRRRRQPRHPPPVQRPFQARPGEVAQPRQCRDRQAAPPGTLGAGRARCLPTSSQEHAVTAHGGKNGEGVNLLPRVPTAPSGSGGADQAASTLISFGLASSFFGSWISSTPSRYVAFTRLGSTTEGSTMLRWNVP